MSAARRRRAPSSASSIGPEREHKDAKRSAKLTSQIEPKWLERAKGIEPSYAAWEAAVLPLNYAREPEEEPSGALLALSQAYSASQERRPRDARHEAYARA